MKKLKYLLMSAACGIAMTSCYDAPTGVSTKHLPGEGEDPSAPDVPANLVSPTPSFPVVTEAVSIDPSTQYQEFEGFGASDCWLGDFIGRYWTTGRADVARMLFSRKVVSGQPQGIGLSMWRVNLGGGSAEQGDESGLVDATSRAEAYLSPSGAYDWNKCVGQRYFMQQAKQMGCEKFVLFANSPLVQFTKNGKASKQGSKNDWHTNLKDDCYDDYAEYLATVAEHFIKEGYNVTHISPANEPQYEWNGDNQEGSSWYNTELATLAREMQRSFDAHGISTNILLGEAGSYTSLYGDNDNNHNMIENFFATGKAAYVGNLKRVDNLICGHSYWTNNTWESMRSVRQQLASKAKARGVRVWQTEWSLLGDAPAELGNYDTLEEFDLAMYMSRVIHCDLAVAGVTSWSYWTAMSVERYGHRNRFEMIYTTPAGGQYSNDWTQNGTVADNPNLWVLGNYSLHIRPGYRRVLTTHKETKDFFATSWLSPDSKRLVTVYTNYNKTNGVMLNTAGSKLPGTPTAVRRYTTTKSKKLVEQYFKPGDPMFLEPYSVTTVVTDF